jgi:hypothetical protein
MKQSPPEKELMRNLGPSKFSAEGFLGSDSRPVDEIVSEDLLSLEKNQVAKETLVEALTNAYETAKEAFGAEVDIRPGVTGVFYESMGRIPSPFQADGVFEKGEAVVKDEEGGHAIVITSLGIHLIKKYGFFQGKGSRYRIDPDRAVKIFRLSHVS